MNVRVALGAFNAVQLAFQYGKPNTLAFTQLFEVEKKVNPNLGR